MTVSFKKFATFLSASEGEQSPEKLDEIWSKIFAKKEADKEEVDKTSKSKVLTAKERLEKKKEEEQERKKELQKKRDDAWARAKEQASGTTRATSSARGAAYARDDYAIQRVRESLESKAEWEEKAQAAGFKIKKLSGDNGDQVWGAFDGDKKMGEFSEEDNSGWIKASSLKESWAKDPKTGKEQSFSKPFVDKLKALEFAKKNGLGAKNVKSRPAGFVVEK